MRELPAPRFGTRVTKRVLVIVGIGLIPTIAGFFVPQHASLHWVASISFIAAGFIAAYVAARELRRFRCPRCGRLIARHEPTSGGEGVPVRYWCQACDVLWDTGLRTPDNL